MKHSTLASAWLVGLAALPPALTAGCTKLEPLVQVQNEADANEILVLLEEAGVRTAQKTLQSRQRQEYWQLLVEADHLAAARRILVRNGLPRPPLPGYADLVASTGLMPSKSDDEARMIHARQGEVIRGLQTIHRVIRAQVVIAPAERPSQHAEPATRPTAAVFIKYLGSRDESHDAGGETTRGHPTDDGVAGTEVAPAAAGSEATVDHRDGDHVVGAEIAPAEDAAATTTAADPADVPISRAAVRSLVAHGVPGLQPGDVEVEFSRVDPYVPAVVNRAAPPRLPMLAALQEDRVLFGSFVGLGALVTGLLVRLYFNAREMGRMKPRRQAAGA